MQREIKRTIQSLLVPYQQGIDIKDLQIIVVDNGSQQVIDYSDINEAVEYYQCPVKTVSPAKAVNFGISKATADTIGVFVDGARLASPGLCDQVIKASKISSRTIVSTLGFHLGPGMQMSTCFRGYNQKVEDDMLAMIEWHNNGYDLFAISHLAGSSRHGLMAPINESNALFMSKVLWQELGGFDERFTSVGGGYVNLDVYKRACELSDTELVMLINEATFHQVHGGIATNQRPGSQGSLYVDEYKKIRGLSFTPPDKKPYLFGQHKPQISSLISSSLSHIEQLYPNNFSYDELNKLLAENTDGLSFDGSKKLSRAQIKAKDIIDEPIIIIGRGGSGTRMLSEMIQDLGVFMGNELNVSADSLEWVKPIYRLVVKDITLKNNKFNQSEIENLRLNALKILMVKGIKSINLWGFKLPETMLCLPELMAAFPKAKIIHLTRHPVTISLRRSHMTSRLNNPIGAKVLEKAYNKFSPITDAKHTAQEVNNALSWKYQLDKVITFAADHLSDLQYLPIKFEDICQQIKVINNKLQQFLSINIGAFSDPKFEIDPLRITKPNVGDPFAAIIWEMCGEIAQDLGYTKDECYGH